LSRADSVFRLSDGTPNPVLSSRALNNGHPVESVILSQGVGEWGDAAKDGREVTVASWSIEHSRPTNHHLPYSPVG
jgi:hypothetical protein